MFNPSSLVRSIKTCMKVEALPAAVLLLTSVLASNPAKATNLYSVLSTSTTIDGGSIALNGSLRDVGSEARPWTAELYVYAGDCVRMIIPTVEFAATLTVVAPTGAVYRDATSGAPKVKIASAPVAGWYTVQVSQQQGHPQIGNFTVLYGRYNSGNMNCASPTLPL